VVVQANGNANWAYWMRSNISTICNLPLQPQALAEIYYQKADTTTQPTTEPWPSIDNGKCNNDDLSLTTPYYSITPNPDPAKTFEVIVDEKVNATGHLEWRLNQQAFRGNYNKPLLLLAQEKNQTYEPEWNVVHPGDSKTVRLIINNNSTISHVSITGLPSCPSYVDDISDDSQLSLCTSTATTCTFYTRVTAIGMANLSRIRTIRNAATFRCCGQGDIS